MAAVNRNGREASDRRLIEDYLPIPAISAEASREKSVRRGHPSTLHLWWARRPLVACRAAVYATLVPSTETQPISPGRNAGGHDARAEQAAFVDALCRYPGSSAAIAEAQQEIWKAHAARLSRETGAVVTPEDVESRRALRPRVLDMFAGGGAIPLEALRLGCDAFALELNPVAHIVELCTLVYPEQFGRPDALVVGSNEGRTWAGLEDEVRYWGRWVLDTVARQIGDLYPPIPDPASAFTRETFASPQLEMAGDGFRRTGQQAFGTDIGCAYLAPVAYLWTRTVPCKNQRCGATVPLVRQTWVCKKTGRFVALKPSPDPATKQVAFAVVESDNENDVGFDPTAFSKEGNAVCFFCGAVADAAYVQAMGQAQEVGAQLMAVVGLRPGTAGKQYISATALSEHFVSNEDVIRRRINALCERTGLTIPTEMINPVRPSPNARGLSAVTRHGFQTFADLFTARQLLALLSFVAAVRDADKEMRRIGYEQHRATAVATLLGALVDRLADFNSSFCTFNFTGGRGVKNTFARQALPMVWDFAETNPFNPEAASWASGINDVPEALLALPPATGAVVERGTATALPWPDAFFDAVVTDPPYYDNVPYADISDFFYVWLKRSIGHLYPEHFASELTPKRSETTALASHHAGNMATATAEYEERMAQAFAECHRTLKPGAPMVIVYAHKTTLGWATLIEALRKARFTVTEAWPLDTERPGRMLAQGTAALASSIFLVARRRESLATGSYEAEVRPELEAIVRERVDTLWSLGVSGADLVIAAIGAGLRAFTRYAEVQYANGEAVPAERFLFEVEGVVLDTLLEKIFGVVGSSVASVDGPSRFYVLWRFTYGAAELDAGEAIVFTYSQPVELDGPRGLTAGTRPLVRKKQGKYCLLDFTERGDSDRLGQPDRVGQAAPLIDVLQRVLWLMEHEPRSLPTFLDEARPDPESLRVLAQALAGAGLKGKPEEDTRAPISTTPAEQSALGKLTANWRTLIEQQLPTAYGPLFAARQ